ncbi:MAG: FtsX-like permease family protein [Bryobacteraceae bacterium]
MWCGKRNLDGLSFYVRSALPPGRMVPQIRRVMQSLDAELPLQDLRTFDDQVNISVRPQALLLDLAGAFAVLATLLAMVGLYGVMAYSVTRRTREIGIRIALGAATARIRGMVMREMLLVPGVGIVVGVPASLGLARFVASLLFGVKPFDATVVAGAVLALSAAALLAGWLPARLPARRATRVDPLLALRDE